MGDLLATLSLVAVLALVGCAGYRDDVEIEGPGSFFFASNMHCEVISATDPDYIGESVDFMDVDSETPRVRFRGAGVRSPMKKTFETEGLLVLQLVASGSGSIDTVTLDKSKGIFVRTYSGDFLGLYAGAAHGVCR